MRAVLLSLVMGLLGYWTANSVLALEDAKEDDAKENVPANSVESAKLIQQLIRTQKVDQAEEEFQRALKEFPDSAEIKNLRVQFYSLMLRLEKKAQALEYASAYLNDQLEILNKEPAKSTSLPVAVSFAGNALHVNGKTDEALERYDQVIATVESKIKEGATPMLATQLDQLQLNKVQSLLAWGRGEIGEPLLQSQLAAAKQALEQSPEEAAAAIRVATVRQMELQYAVRLHPEMVGALRTEIQKFLADQFQKHPEQFLFLSHYNSATTQAVSSIGSSDPVEAVKIIGEWKEFLSQVESSNANVQNIVKFGKQNAEALEQRLAADLKRRELIGQAAFPLDVQDWVNGAALTGDDLKGKVVLLDFWAVWCGPCIATFPHLREWNEKYSEQGLVIVGMTHYYEFDWDEDAKRSKIMKGLAPEKEQEAMVKFAEHHQLKHRFAVMPKGSQFDRQYGVTGIPQAVLIDRAGNIRMIRVGSGDKNAHDLSEMLEQLIAE